MLNKMQLNVPHELLAELFYLLQILYLVVSTPKTEGRTGESSHLMAEEAVSTELLYAVAVCASPSPTRKSIVNGQKVRVFCIQPLGEQLQDRIYRYSPTRNVNFAASAASSLPMGATKGDFALRVAAIVNAGSRQRKTVAINRNLPR